MLPLALGSKIKRIPRQADFAKASTSAKAMVEALAKSAWREISLVTEPRLPSHHCSAFETLASRRELIRLCAGDGNEIN